MRCRPPIDANGLTILFAEQSIELALEVADCATVLRGGNSGLSGTASDMVGDPRVQKTFLGTLTPAAPP